MALKENKIPSQEDLKSQPTKFTDEELNKLQKEEADLAGSLSTKYGKGTLNAETGEFTPSE